MSNEQANEQTNVQAGEHANVPTGTQVATTAAVEPTSPVPHDGASSHLVPVSESIRYRKRAQAAEQEMTAMQSRLEESEKELTQLRQAVSTMERRQKIDALLADANAVDTEVARLLTEAAVEAMAEPDVQLAIDDLRRSKPYLFNARRAEAGAMGARGHDLSEQADLAADAAVRSGDRRDLLRYLRLRRNGHGTQV